MTRTTSQLARYAHYAFAPLATAFLLAACADRAPSGPSAGASPAGARVASKDVRADPRFPDLGICTQLQVPEGSKITLKVFGIGSQIYRWTGTSWQFVTPDAKLYADAGGHGLVGTHFSGPTWKSNSGSEVKGTVALNGRCTPDASAIAWLKLDAVVTGSGVFNQTTHIQRLNTVGGLAPSTPGSLVGEEVAVPYTADYLFYRAPSADATQ